jgi:hypothetical protein
VLFVYLLILKILPKQLVGIFSFIHPFFVPYHVSLDFYPQVEMLPFLSLICLHQGKLILI